MTSPDIRPAGISHTAGSTTIPSGDRTPAAADTSPAFVSGRGNAAVRRPASDRQPVRKPNAAVCTGPPRTKTRRCNATIAALLRRGPRVSARLVSADAASDPAASAPEAPGRRRKPASRPIRPLRQSADRRAESRQRGGRDELTRHAGARGARAGAEVAAYRRRPGARSRVGRVGDGDTGREAANKRDARERAAQRTDSREFED
jgi:hypothetical protein